MRARPENHVSGRFGASASGFSDFQIECKQWDAMAEGYLCAAKRRTTPPFALPCTTRWVPPLATAPNELSLRGHIHS